MNNDVKQIRAICLRWLAAREYSKKELLNKLAVKGYQHDAVVAVIDELAEDGWQDDLRYAESYVRSRLLKGYGPARIVYELQLNGIDMECINLDAMVQVTAGSWASLLEQVYSKKFGQDNQFDMNDWARRSRFLTQRGFTGDMISELLKQLNILRFNR